ncbi:MAG: hypothetical protein ACKO7D_11165 [Bacteroidota bacterium]
MKFIVTFLLLSSLHLSAQSIKLKKKYLKTYVGKIPSYEMNLNNQLILVNPSTIEVILTKDSIYVNVGESKWNGTYVVSKIEKQKYELTGKMLDTGIPERLIIDTKLKKLTRKGLFPQPDAILEKKK